MRRGPLANLCLSASFVLVSASAFAQGAKPKPAKIPAAAPAKDAAPAPPRRRSRSGSGGRPRYAFGGDGCLQQSALRAPAGDIERAHPRDRSASVCSRRRSSPRAGRRDEEIGMLVRLVESPRFADYADSGEGHAAVYALGDALATEGAHEPARGYLRRLLALSPNDTYARRAVRRLVEIAIDTDVSAPILEDLKAVPSCGPARGDARRDRVLERSRPPARQRSRRRLRFLRAGHAEIALLGAGGLPLRAHRGRSRALEGRREPVLQGGRSGALGEDRAVLRRREVLTRFAISRASLSAA